VQPDLKSTTSAEPSPSPAVDVAQLEKKLERAKRSTAAGERLYKIGAIAKVEAEQRALRVVRLQSDLAKAQLVNAQKSAGIATGMVQTVDVKPTSGVDSRIVFAEAKAAADTAVANLAKAELDAAAINVQRQKKLLALGSARKSDVVRAEEKLAALKNNNPR
jgi:hypothetical protein